MIYMAAGHLFLSLTSFEQPTTSKFAKMLFANFSVSAPFFNFQYEQYAPKDAPFNPTPKSRQGLICSHAGGG